MAKMPMQLKAKMMAKKGGAKAMDAMHGSMFGKPVKPGKSKKKGK